MLLREPFLHTFYNAIIKKPVVVLVANDVDAVCSATILGHLLYCAYLTHSVAPMASWSSVERHLHAHVKYERNFVLINCVGSNDATNLPLHPNSKLFIVDSRRPIHVNNAYHNEQIKVIALGKEVDEELNIPAFESVYMAESDEDAEEDEDDEDVVPRKRNRMENIERRALKKTARQQWEKKRGDILWKYYENSWVSTASSVVMLKVAAELSCATAEVVWITSIGISSQFTDGDISLNGYMRTCYDHMKEYLTKFAPPKGRAKGDDLLRIKVEKEIPLALYQQWSLIQAMKVNPFFACQTKNWNQRGESRMKHKLAEIGLTLDECRQKFSGMTQEKRKMVFRLLYKAMGTKLDTFMLHQGFNERVSAFDVARALSTRLGSAAVDCATASTPNPPAIFHIPASLASSLGNCLHFLQSYIDSLPDMTMLHKMFAQSKTELEGIWTAVAAVINECEVLPHGHFYLYSTNKRRDSSLVSRPALFAFAQFLAAAFSECKKGRNKKPLVVSFPSFEDGWLIVLGIMPLATIYDDHHHKSFMGRAFEQIAKEPKINIRREFFDPNIVLLKTEDRGRFFDHLEAKLETV